MAVETPEAVAYQLLQNVISIEKKSIVANPGDQNAVDRKWLLNAYADCFNVVKGGRLS